LSTIVSIGDEADLSWLIENIAADGIDNPEIACIRGTGTSAAARSAAPVASCDPQG
jgi:hypothetical protein